LAVLSDYYAILGIERNALSAEIKKAFRKKAKLLHPDTVNGSRESDEEIKLLLLAYSILSDPGKRSDYDRTLRKISDSDFNYRDFLKNRKSDPYSQSKLIFHDLLHNHEEEALILFEELVYRKNYSLEDYMDREDFMDCAFLLAEEYERKNEYEQAFLLLKKITVFEKKKPYFKHFMQEVSDRFKNITCNKMSKKLHPSDQMSYLNELRKLDLSKKLNEAVIKKMNQIYAKM